MKVSQITLPDLIQAIRIAWLKGIPEKEKTLRGKNAVKFTYLRYIPDWFIDELIGDDGIYWDTRYIGGGPHSRGRTVYVFGVETIRYILEYLELDTTRHANISSTEDLIKKQWEKDRLYKSVTDGFHKLPIQYVKQGKQLLNSIIFDGANRVFSAKIFADFLEEAGMYDEAWNIRIVLGETKPLPFISNKIIDFKSFVNKKQL